MRVYVFVDAENHFLRSVAAAEKIIGSPQAADALARARINFHEPVCFPPDINDHRFGIDRDMHLFWDCMAIHRFGLSSGIGTYVERAVFVTSCAGDDDKAHQMRVDIRNIGFEPIVIREPKDLYRQRIAMREKAGLIDKPKGCDIALVTRMVADAAANLYDCCCLFTSDADYLPAIEAVRRLGKVVIVGGYRSVLPDRSPYLYVPDRFVDLEEALATVWHDSQARITAALESIAANSQAIQP